MTAFKERGVRAMKRRVFVALGISYGLQKEILSWEKSFSGLPVRWLSGKNLHVTLIPPWYESDLNLVSEKLRNIRDIGSFEIEFNSVSYGPDPRRPRLIWASGPAPEKMIFLKKESEKVLGREPEARPFRLHLTLARFREEEFPQFPVKEIQEKVLWQDKTSSFILMESHLSKAGADYSVLEEFVL